MKQRNRIEIAANILEIAWSGAIKTRIMYGARLSYPQLKDYFELLTDSGLLEYDKEEKKYFTTEKGELFLKSYKEIRNMIP